MLRSGSVLLLSPLSLLRLLRLRVRLHLRRGLTLGPRGRVRELVHHGYKVRACLRDGSSWRGEDAIQYVQQVPSRLLSA
eukprot:COSAG04_NODE_260_length_18679_cov_4.566439_9_plen_79_part_00